MWKSKKEEHLEHYTAYEVYSPSTCEFSMISGGS